MAQALKFAPELNKLHQSGFRMKWRINRFLPDSAESASQKLQHVPVSWTLRLFTGLEFPTMTPFISSPLKLLLCDHVIDTPIFPLCAPPVSRDTSSTPSRELYLSRPTDRHAAFLQTGSIRKDSVPCFQYSSDHSISDQSIPDALIRNGSLILKPCPQTKRLPTTMPVVQPGSKILVTGGNGYIGVSAIGFLLERGYAIRATVRREVDWLSALFKERYKEKFEVVVVEDMTKVGVGFLILTVLTVATFFLGRSV